MTNTGANFIRIHLFGHCLMPRRSILREIIEGSRRRNCLSRPETQEHHDQARRLRQGAGFRLAQLGEQKRAHAALQELLALVRDFDAIAREEYSKWLDAELAEEMMDGLRKAGMEIAPEKGPGPDSAAI